MNIAKPLSVAVSVLAISGCMTFNEKMLRAPKNAPLPTNPVSLETKTGTLLLKHNGEGTNEGPLSGTTVASALANSIGQRWKSKGIVSEYGAPGGMKSNPDYTMTISGIRNEESSIGMAVLGGLSMMLIPTSSTLVYDLDVELVDNRTSAKYQAKAKNGVTTVMEIIFLPALPFSWMGSSGMLDDVANHLYSEFASQGAFNGGMPAKP